MVNREDKALCHDAWQQNVWTWTNRGPANMAEKNYKKTDLYDFPVHDYTQEQNGSP